MVQVVDDYSSKSFRLLAIAAGVLHDVDKLDLGSASLQHLESCCTLHLLGLTVLSNHLRPESKDTLSQLQDMAWLRCNATCNTYLIWWELMRPCSLGL